MTKPALLREYIALRIRYLRQQKGLSQDKLSELADLDVKHINKIENNAPNLELGTVEKIIAALGENYETFFDCQFPTGSEEIKKLIGTLENIPFEDQKEVIEAIITLVKKMENHS